MTAHLTGRSFAKINLGLRVLRKRPDGFHDIKTIFHRIGLHDIIVIREAAELSVASSDPAAPSDRTNLAYRAAELLQNASGTHRGASISIAKNIPVGAGLGGGSSNAATVLMMLQDFWGARVAGARLREIALELGSDVPFFLGTGSAEASGRGEVLSYFELALPFAILVCTPPVQVSTARAYRAVTPDDDGSRRSMREELIGALEEPGRLQETLRNDFESPVCAEFPVIAGARQSLLAAGAACASLSGSGSSVFGLFPELESAEKAALPLRSSGMRTHITLPGFRG